MTQQLVGRQAEVARLGDLIDAAPAGGSALLVVGEPGVGKSALLRVAVQLARDAGFRVLQTTGVESETQLPYAGLHQLLAPVLSRVSALPAAQRTALATALGLEAGAPPEPFLVALATLTLLSETAASCPVLVGVDDVQWLDPPTQDVVVFVARRVSGDPIVIVCAAREGHPGPFLTAGLEQLDLLALDGAAARELVARSAEDLGPAERERILGEALGNPLALVELPTAWRGSPDLDFDEFVPLPARLERAFAGRICELPPKTRDVLLVAAVDDVDELPEMLRAAAQLVGDDVGVDDLDGAVAARLVRFDALRMRFRHPLMRSGVLQTESAIRRQRAHAALAAVIDDDTYRRTWHRAHAVVDRDDQVADELDANHRIALGRGALAPAIRALERSAQLTTDPAKRAHRLLLAAEHAFDLGRADMVDRLVKATSRSPLSELDRARVTWCREIFNDAPGDAARVIELCDMAGRSADLGDTALALKLLQAGATRCYWAEPGPEARACVADTVSGLDGVQDEPLATAILAVAEPLARAGAVTDRLSALGAVSDPDALLHYGAAARCIGDPARCVDFLTQAESELREQGRLGLLAHVQTMQALALVELGDWHRAAICCEEGRRYAEETGQHLWSMGVTSATAVLAGLRGDLEQAQALAAEAEAVASRRPLKVLLAWGQLARGFGWITNGHYAEGYDALRRMFDPCDPAFHATERFRAVRSLADAAVRTGRDDDARSVVAGLEVDAKVTPSPTLHVGLSFARAVLAPDDEADGLFVSALSQDLVRWPFTRARLQLAYGGWLRRHRRSAESRPLLRAARPTLEHIGATWWAEQARAELRAAGERTPSSVVPIHEALSPQELQIAQLAAEGLSNKQIGERLYMSHRTVGSHLYRIFPKLDITSRAQLASRLAGS